MHKWYVHGHSVVVSYCQISMNVAICDTIECENGGTCSAPNNCSCTAEWSGDTCDQGNFVSCCIVVIHIQHCAAVCSHTCANGGTCTSPGTCTCVEGWVGTACNTPICNPPCENGNCTQPGQCTCHVSWTGETCREGVRHCMYMHVLMSIVMIAMCGDGFCRNGGECLYPDTNCTCTPDWQGDQCGIGTANVYVCVYTCDQNEL